MTSDNGSLLPVRQINLNTVFIIAGFLGTFATMMTSYANLQADQKSFHQFAIDQRNINSRLDERVKQLEVSDLTSIVKEDLDIARVKIEKLADSHAMKFSEIQMSLNTMAIQLALLDEAVSRMNSPPRSRSPNPGQR